MNQLQRVSIQTWLASAGSERGHPDRGYCPYWSEPVLCMG